MVAEHFKKLGATVREQPFKGVDPVSNAPVNAGQQVEVVEIDGLLLHVQPAQH